jgi:hypothetical protein
MRHVYLLRRLTGYCFIHLYAPFFLAEQNLKRVTRIQSTLSADLDHLFASILNILANDKGPIKVLEEKAKLMADLSECLRTYDVLHLWPDAEDVLRREIMRPFVKKVSYNSD